MKRILRYTCMFLMMAVIGLGSVELVSADEKAVEIIGVAKCKVCHKSAKRGNQYEAWETSVHANAFATLANEQSLAIAKEMGIENPQEAAECLYCHVTSAFLEGVPTGAKYSNEEGVGCEACHGAGSLYKSMKVMKDREAAVAAGMIVGDEATCLKCHNEKSPTYKEFSFEKNWPEIVHPGAATE